MKIDVQAGIGAQHCHDIIYNEKKDMNVVFVLSNMQLTTADSNYHHLTLLISTNCYYFSIFVIENRRLTLIGTDLFYLILIPICE